MDADNRLSDERYFVFYDRTSSPEGALRITEARPNASTTFEVDLETLPSSVRKLVFVLTLDDGSASTLSQLRSGGVTLATRAGQVAGFMFSGGDFNQERAVIAFELYFKDVWRVAAVGQGFAGGLGALLKHFGGNESLASVPRRPNPLPANAPPIAPAPVAPAPVASAPNFAPPPPRVTAPNFATDACCDCGKTLNLVERGMGGLAGVARCGPCHLAFRRQERAQAQARADEERVLREQQLAQVLNGHLPVLAPQSAGIVLRMGEVCHYAAPADLYEEREKGELGAGFGAAPRVHVGRGVSLSIGAVLGKHFVLTGMVKIDSGRLVLTNQRCVFNGRRRSFSVAHRDLVAFEPFADGLELYPENKETQRYKLGDGGLAAAILSVALNA